MIIRTENLSKRYRRNDALADVSFEVPEGSVFALAGENGAGKSTAIRIFMNLIRPDSGRALLFGVDSRHLGSGELAQIGYVSEDQKLPEWMRVGYFMRYCSGFYPAWDDSLATELLKRFDLPPDRKLGALSRGMKMKAALAASLAYRPKLIILDEPFSGLDILVREQLIESLVDCTPEATVLIASHDLAEIESFSTHVGYLSGSHLQFVEEIGPLASRFRDVEITLAQSSDVPKDLPASWLNVEHSGSAVRFTDASYEPSRLREEVSSRFTGIREIQPRAMSLRSIFLALARSRKTLCA